MIDCLPCWCIAVVLQYLLWYDAVQSVVLGQCQPDEIAVLRSWDDKLSVKQKTIGNKELCIALACMLIDINSGLIIDCI